MKQTVLAIAALFTTALLFVGHANSSVVGQLSRMQVPNPASVTYRVYGQVDEFCSGTMIAPRLVLTAGHCVYDVETAKPTNLKFFAPSRNGKAAPFGKIPVVAIHVAEEYIKGNPDRDLAVLVLRDPIGNSTGWLQIAWDHSVLAPHASALGGWSGPGTIAGYPGDKDKNTMWLVACDFYVAPLLPRRPQYTCDTYGGMSGSSLVVAGPRGVPYVIGVHTTGRGNFNTGVVLSGENKTFLQKILANYRF